MTPKINTFLFPLVLFFHLRQRARVGVLLVLQVTLASQRCAR